MVPVCSWILCHTFQLSCFEIFLSLRLPILKRWLIKKVSIKLLIRSKQIALLALKTNFNVNWMRIKMIISLIVPNIEFNFDASVWHCLLSIHTTKLNLTLGTHLPSMIRNHHFDFDIRYWPISALMAKTFNQSWIWFSVLLVILFIRLKMLLWIQWWLKSLYNKISGLQEVNNPC